jgi:hypothetical protein
VREIVYRFYDPFDVRERLKSKRIPDARAVNQAKCLLDARQQLCKVVTIERLLSQLRIRRQATLMLQGLSPNNNGFQVEFDGLTVQEKYWVRVHIPVILGPVPVLQRLPKTLKNQPSGFVIRTSVILQQIYMVKPGRIQAHVPAKARAIRKF